MFAGFADKYYFSSSVHLKSLPLLVHLHAAAFTAWVILLWLQTALIAVGRADIHRRLGLISVAMYIVMIVLGIKTAIFGAQNGWSPGGPFHDSLGFLVVGLVDLLLFSIFVISGLWFRRHKEAHKRLMILAAIGGLLWPSITRVSIFWGRITLLVGARAS